MTILKRFLFLLRPHYRQGLGIAALLLVSTGFTVGTPYLYKELVDGGIMARDRDYVVQMVILIATALGLQELLYLLQIRLTLNVRRGVFTRLRMDLYAHLMRMPQSFHSRHSKGRMLSRITSDVDAVQNLLLEKYIYFAQNVLVGAAVFVIIFVLDRQMVFFAGLFLPLIYVFYLAYRRSIFSLSKRAQEMQETMMERLQEDLATVKAIQSYGAAGERLEAANGRIEETEEARRRLSMRYSVASSTTVVINMIGVSVIWGIGGNSVIDGQMSMGTLIAISFYLTYVVNLFFNAYYTVMGFQKSKPAAERIFEILDHAPDIADRPGAADRAIAGESVVFRDVAFAYGDGAPVLENVSFTLRKGDFVGIVGASGEGKTTLANLLLRFYDPVKGAVEIGGEDIRSMKLESLRRQTAVVTQEDYLFNQSIRDNILMGRRHVPEDAFRRACGAASLDAVAAALENGWDTVIGENGMRLSSGQRKRISIARALLENPYIVIFDEATSVLDERTERDIMHTAARLSEDRIVLVISHNMSNLLACSKVLHVEQARVVQYDGLEAFRRREEKDIHLGLTNYKN